VLLKRLVEPARPDTVACDVPLQLDAWALDAWRVQAVGGILGGPGQEQQAAVGGPGRLGLAGTIGVTNAL
jgi:hypothetical protein